MRGNDCPLKYMIVKHQGQVRSLLFMEDCETEKFRSSTTSNWANSSGATAPRLSLKASPAASMISAHGHFVSRSIISAVQTMRTVHAFDMPTHRATRKMYNSRLSYSEDIFHFLWLLVYLDKTFVSHSFFFELEFMRIYTSCIICTFC